MDSKDNNTYHAPPLFKVPSIKAFTTAELISELERRKKERMAKRENDEEEKMRELFIIPEKNLKSLNGGEIR